MSKMTAKPIDRGHLLVNGGGGVLGVDGIAVHQVSAKTGDGIARVFGELISSGNLCYMVDSHVYVAGLPEAMIEHLKGQHLKVTQKHSPSEGIYKFGQTVSYRRL